MFLMQSFVCKLKSSAGISKYRRAQMIVDTIVVFQSGYRIESQCGDG